MVRTLETKGNGKSQLTLRDLREALYNGEADRREDLDVLREMASDKDGLLKKIEANDALTHRLGGKDNLKTQFEQLHMRYGEVIRNVAALKTFQEKVEKKGILRRMLSGLGSYAKRHPFVTALLLASAASAGVAAGFYFTGNWELLMSGVGALRKQIAAGVGRSLPLLDPKTPPLPGSGVEGVPGGGPINL
jgi:hypothetical protein